MAITKINVPRPALKSKHSVNGEAKTNNVKALPMTLSSGYVGCGKTTLLRNNHGLRIAVIVNSIGAYVISRPAAQFPIAR